MAAGQLKAGKPGCPSVNDRLASLFGEPYWASLVAQMVKNLPAVQETRVRSLGLEDHLEKRMATHSSVLVWRIPWTEDRCVGSQRVRHD